MIEDGWQIAMSRFSPATSFASGDASFSQRMTYTVAADNHKVSAIGEQSENDVTWEPDLEVTYHRAR